MAKKVVKKAKKVKEVLAWCLENPDGDLLPSLVCPTRSVARLCVDGCRGWKVRKVRITTIG